jgi:nucleoid-associated protein YgaU
MGKFEKMIIQAYSDENFSGKAGTPFEMMINPETYSHTYSTKYTDRKNIGSNAQAADFNQMTKEKLSFKVVFDSTGVVPLSDANKGKDVKQMVKELKAIVYDYQGKIHQPYFVELLWGALLFKGKLDTLTLEYKLFRSDGTPLRANVSLSFVGYISEEMAAAQANTSSPDMTHVVTIKEGDTLVELCRQVYGKSKYYLQVAEKNDLASFRYLKPGSKLNFPPLK